MSLLPCGNEGRRTRGSALSVRRGGGMTIRQALDSYYHRLDGVAEPGQSPEKFGWCIVLGRDGAVIDVENLHDLSGKKPRPKTYKIGRASCRERVCQYV